MAVDPTRTEQQPPPAAPPDAPPAPAAPEQPPAPEPAPAPAPPAYGWDGDLGPTLHGVPLIAAENPFGGFGLGILVGLDLEATHEVGQKFTSPETIDSEGRKLPRSGGAAYYVDQLNGKGWTVPLNPEEV